MLNQIIQDANVIIKKTIQSALPSQAVIDALNGKTFSGGIYIAAIGKAAYPMAISALSVLGNNVKKTIVVTKYGHAEDPVEGIKIIEAGHPVIDENSIAGTNEILDMVQNLNEEDTVLFLVSGGGSALFEKPLDGITLEDIQNINRQLLACGADIVEMNIIRKRLSAVKGGRFAELCRPASVYSIVLSDVIGDRLDSIASGPAYPDCTTVEDALKIIQKYNLQISSHILEKIHIETPKKLHNVETAVTGSVRVLCENAAKFAKELGYKPYILTSTLECQAKEAGKFLGYIARDMEHNSTFKPPFAVIVGGETTVVLKGKGLGGRNQEFALAAADVIAGIPNAVIFSVGSDGTDGPTDAAGGIVNGTTRDVLKSKGIDICQTLDSNDAYHALKECEGLVITGPTGTNVNDFAMLLVK